jgi:hypothetical protein
MPTGNEGSPSSPHQADHTQLPLRHISSILVINLRDIFITGSVDWLLRASLPPRFPFIPVPKDTLFLMIMKNYM